MGGSDKKEIKLGVGMVVNRVLKSFAKPVKLTDIKSYTNLKDITLINNQGFLLCQLKKIIGK